MKPYVQIYHLYLQLLSSTDEETYLPEEVSDVIAKCFLEIFTFWIKNAYLYV